MFNRRTSPFKAARKALSPRPPEDTDETARKARQIQLDLQAAELNLERAQAAKTEAMKDALTGIEAAARDHAVARAMVEVTERRFDARSVEISGVVFHTEPPESLGWVTLGRPALTETTKSILEDAALTFNFPRHPPPRPEYLIGSSDLQFLTGYLCPDTE